MSWLSRKRRLRCSLWGRRHHGREGPQPCIFRCVDHRRPVFIRLCSRNGSLEGAHHLVIGLEALQCQILGLETLVRALGGGDDRRIGDQWVMDTWVWNQVSLELVQIDVQGAIESKGRSDGADNLGDQTVQVLE